MFQETARDKLTELIKAQYHFYGYDNSVYEYDKFDTFTEKQLADYVDYILKDTDSKDRPFWVRNERNIYFSYGTRKYYPDFIMAYKDMIYVIETKGEIFSDTRKNALLAKLDEVPGYKGVLVFSTQLDEMGSNYCGFEDFLKESNDVINRMQSKDNLVQSPVEEEKFIKFLPAYAPDKAYRKFYKKSDKVQCDGWIEVDEGSYTETSFMVQVKGNALLPKLRHNEWCIIDASFDKQALIGQVILVRNKSLNDEYKGNYTIRVLNVREENVEGMLLPEQIISLDSIDDRDDSIDMKGATEEDLHIIGAAIIQ